jgi:NTP pyrophosphatase (non-canonical NTP hydrolase)
MNSTDFRDLTLAIEEEYIRARNNSNKPFNSAHEGYAVLLEEVDELWEEVRKKKSVRSKKRMEEECIQIAAMAIRFIADVCDENK